MAELSNIYEEQEGPKGPDLDVVVEVPRHALGLDDGFVVPVADRLEKDGRKIQRAISPHEPERGIRLRLPADFPSGGTLRFRRQGGLPERDGHAGDLYVKVRITDVAPAPHWSRRVALGLALIIVAVWTSLAVAAVSGWGLPR